jgi:hypothetical protein
MLVLISILNNYNELLRKAARGQNNGEIMNEWNKDDSCMATTLPVWGSRIGNDARSWPTIHTMQLNRSEWQLIHSVT